MQRDPFNEYIKQIEPDKKEKSYAWQTAIGLQEVDGLKPSEYLYETAVKNIEGDITFDEAKKLISDYYEVKERRESLDRTKEADIVSVRIAEILSEDAFTFNLNEYISIHSRLFDGVFSHAGKIRDFNITKKEWVLDGATVTYGSASGLMETFEYDLKLERQFSYKGLSMDETIEHLARFISNLWKIHIFAEGNTRTTTVFFIKYLRTLGFDVANDTFADNSWYFRNALVRANYNDIKNGIYETTEYVEKFLRCLLLGEECEFDNRELHI